MTARTKRCLAGLMLTVLAFLFLSVLETPAATLQGNIEESRLRLQRTESNSSRLSRPTASDHLRLKRNESTTRIEGATSPPLQGNIEDSRVKLKGRENQNRRAAQNQQYAWIRQWFPPAPMASTPAPPVPRFSLKNALFNFQANHCNVPLSARETTALSRCDVTIILDHSGSMGTPDCPLNGIMPESRLQWCKEELLRFTQELKDAFPRGYNFITYDSNPDAYRITSSMKLWSILQALPSGGSTRLERALDLAFRQHNKQRDEPLVIAVISDCEINVSRCCQVIAAATRSFPLPNGVSITFLQIGFRAQRHMIDSGSLLRQFQSLPAAGAAYNPVSIEPFTAVLHDGLGRDLLRALHSTQMNSPLTPTPYGRPGNQLWPSGPPIR